MPRILLGVSGGIAAYKALELVRLATAAGHSVRAVMTPTAERFVGPASFAALTGAPVLVSEFEADPARGSFPGEAVPDHQPLSHLELVRRADVYLIAPASANTLAKLAHGLADNLLTSAALAASCPLLVAPAMNNHMYEHPATQANLDRLRLRGVTVIAPGRGRLGSLGEWGVGRLAEPADLLRACVDAVRAGDGSPRSPAGGGPWDGLRVLITAGGTREPIDSVRFVGNRSSGRMGWALAEAAAARGAQVTVLAANVTLERHPGVHYRSVSTAAELQQACQELFADTDVLFMAAAVADFRPAAAAAEKIKKAGRARLTVELEATPDILAGLAAIRRPDQTVVGFAAEHGQGAVAYGREKLAAKGLDAVVVNDISRPEIGFDSRENEVTILTAEAEQRIARAPKEQIAQAVLDVVDRLRSQRPARA